MFPFILIGHRICSIQDISKSPLFGDEFIEKLKKVFAMIPEKYDIELTVIIDDHEDYSKQALCDIFNDNTTLGYKTIRSEQKSKHRVAAGLVSLGVLFFVLMVFISAVFCTTFSFISVILPHLYCSGRRSGF